MEPGREYMQEITAPPFLNTHSSEVDEMTFQAIKTSVMKFVKDEDGLTIVEYAVAGGLITVFVVLAFQNLGTEVGLVIQAMCNAVSNNAGTCSAGAA